MTTSIGQRVLLVDTVPFEGHEAIVELVEPDGAMVVYVPWAHARVTVSADQVRPTYVVSVDTVNDRVYRLLRVIEGQGKDGGPTVGSRLMSGVYRRLIDGRSIVRSFDEAIEEVADSYGLEERREERLFVSKTA